VRLGTARGRLSGDGVGAEPSAHPLYCPNLDSLSCTQFNRHHAPVEYVLSLLNFAACALRSAELLA
jgi:hypothetical protein